MSEIYVFEVDPTVSVEEDLMRFEDTFGISLEDVLRGEVRGEQPDGQALPADRAMSGDTPHSYPSESEGGK